MIFRRQRDVTLMYFSPTVLPVSISHFQLPTSYAHRTECCRQRPQHRHTATVNFTLQTAPLTPLYCHCQLHTTTAHSKTPSPHIITELYMKIRFHFANPSVFLLNICKHMPIFHYVMTARLSFVEISQLVQSFNRKNTDNEVILRAY